MKKIQLAALLVLTGSGFYTQSAQALTYTAGDLLIGFRTATNTSTDYLIDVGSFANYTLNNGSTFTLNIGSTGSDLASVLGDASWYTSGNTFWGIAGGRTINPGINAQNILYVGQRESTTGTVDPFSASYAAQTSSNQGSILTAGISTAGTDYGQNGSAFSAGSLGTAQTGSGDANSWYSLAGHGGPAFGQFAGGFFEGNLQSGGAGTSIDLFQISPTNKGGTGLTTYQGTFHIGSTGAITYQTAGTVPEPSTWTALAGGAGLLGLVRRRRAVVA